MDYKQMTAPCGLDCFNCPLYAAVANAGLRKTIAGRMGIAEDLAQCKGCRNENGTIRAIGKTEPCKAYKCITEKNLDFCFECGDFPCANLQPYADQAGTRPHNIKVFNCCLIKKMGLEKWAKESSKQVRDAYYKGKFSI
jgi:Protein of unknown function (DUF3795)